MAAWLRVPVDIDGVGSGGVCTNVWTFTVPEAGGPSDPAVSAALARLSEFYGDISVLYNSDAIISCDTAYYYVDDVLTTLLSGTAFTVVTGSGVGVDQAPDGLALIVRWRTALPSRSGRGRTYIGPLAALAATGNEPSSTTLATLDGAAQSLVEDSLVDDGWDLAVYSPTDGVAREVISTNVNPEFGYLRSRRT